MFEVACNGILRIVWGRYMEAVAVSYSIKRRLGLVTKENKFYKSTVFHNSTREIYSSCAILGLDSLHTHVGSCTGTDLPDAKFAIPVFQICASDGQFGEHSRWTLRSFPSRS
jgi:hypothetical protein